MALVDADYKFIWADIGGMGSTSDAQIYNTSELKECVWVFRQYPRQQQHGPRWVALCFCLCRLDLFLRDRDRQQQQESSSSNSMT